MRESFQFYGVIDGPSDFITHLFHLLIFLEHFVFQLRHLRCETCDNFCFLIGLCFINLLKDLMDTLESLLDVLHPITLLAIFSNKGRQLTPLLFNLSYLADKPFREVIDVADHLSADAQ